MRHFSNFEKEIIRRIVENDSTSEFQQSLHNMINSVYLKEKIYVTMSKGFPTLLLTTNKKDEEINSLLSRVRSELISTMVLLEYLKSLYLISFDVFPKMKNDAIAKNETLDKVQLMIGKVEDAKVITDEEYLCDFYNNFIYSFIYTSDELRSIVANNYKTDEQKNTESQLAEAKKQTTFARWTFFVSILTILISLIALIVAVKTLK